MKNIIFYHYKYQQYTSITDYTLIHNNFIYSKKIKYSLLKNQTINSLPI